jgi:ABC-type sugar transport system permease subunit
MTLARLRRQSIGYALIAPAVLAAIVFLFIPMILSFYWSFTDYNGVKPPTWVGLDNYATMLANPRFQRSFWNTVAFVIMGMAVGPALGLGSALLLNRAIAFRGVFRVAFFLPVMTSLVVVATIWKMLYNENGLINTVLEAFSLPGHNWLSDPNTALPSIAAASIWQGFGFETVVFLAALGGIPREYYDAARVDGAGRWAQFRHVTLPGLRPTILFVYIIGIIGSFQVFDQVFVMTQGGPVNATRTLVFQLYDKFNSLNLGEASAVAYFLFVVLASLSWIQFRFFGERE